MNRSREIRERKGYDKLFTLDPELWQAIQQNTPHDICSRCWVEFRQGYGFSFSFLGKECVVDLDQRAVFMASGGQRRKASFQEALVTLTYLAKATAVDPTGVMITEKKLKGGDLFFQGPHALFTRPLLERYESRPQEFVAKAKKLEGIALDYGDAAVKLRPLPKIPLVYILYRGDEEFDAAMVVSFDETIQSHLPLDVIWALVNVTSLVLAGESE